MKTTVRFYAPNNNTRSWRTHSPPVLTNLERARRISITARQHTPPSLQDIVPDVSNLKESKQNNVYPILSPLTIPYRERSASTTHISIKTHRDLPAAGQATSPHSTGPSSDRSNHKSKPYYRAHSSWIRTTKTPTIVSRRIRQYVFCDRILIYHMRYNTMQRNKYNLKSNNKQTNKSTNEKIKDSTDKQSYLRTINYK